MLPDKVKIAGIEYTVDEKEFVIIDESVNYAGSCNYKDTKIEILKNMPVQRKEETLVHEILHAVLYEAGFRDHDEDLVDRASRVLYQVLKDNEFQFNKPNKTTERINHAAMLY